MRSSPSFKYFCISLLILFCILLNSCGISVNSGENIEASQEFSFTNLINPDDTLEKSIFINLVNPLAEDETLYVEIVDEISGISENVVEYELRKIDEISYDTLFSCTRGSVVKYRYAKMGNDYQTELAADGSTIRYRLLNCQDGYVQTDILSTWPGEPFSGKSGKLTGKVLDQKSGSPLANMLISISGYQTYTDFLGDFSIEKLPIGNQAITVYSIDGSHKTFQQTADILDGLTTKAEIKIVALPEINVTFLVSPPDDAKGAPIKMVGNLYQLGNTFSDLSGGLSVLSSRSPIMTRLEDGRYKLQIKLHAGNDLRYRYTLGDGYWNAEQGLPIETNYRQIILPNKDLIIEDKILGWRYDNQNPKVIQVSTPESTPISDSISIQFYKNDQWYEPLSMWPMGGQQWIYLLFTPFDLTSEISYRFCRNGICDIDGIPDDTSDIFKLDMLNNTSVSHVINSWPLWQEQIEPTTTEPENIPIKDESYLTGIEFTNKYHPSYLNQLNFSLQEIAENGTNWVVLTPSWKINSNFDYPKLEPALHVNYDIDEVIFQAQKKGLVISIYPQIDFEMQPSDWWHDNLRDEYWWQEYYKEYARFILNYAQLAEKYNLAHIIIGGDFAFPAMPGSIIPTESEIGTPGNADEIWLDLIDEIRTVYKGQVFLSLPFSGTEIARYEFMNNIDGFYILFAPKISDNDETSNLEEIKPVIASYLDNEVKQLFDTQSKNVYISLSYPSANGVARLCVLDLNNNCTSQTYITNTQSFYTNQIDLQEQLDLYNASLYEIINREWISGLSSRGYFFPLKLLDIGSSINGKPASDALWFWYAGVRQ